MPHRFITGAILLGLLGLGVIIGCKKATAPSSAPSLPVVPVSNPVQREVSDYVEYTGRIDARQSVGIKARATGFLQSFGKDKNGKTIAEGSEVSKDELLFQIDPRPYQYQLAQAKSQVTVVEKQLKLAQITLNRDKESFTKGAGSQQQVDQDEASVAETQARLEAAQTAVRTYELNLTYASVTAPIAGQLSRFYYTPGNLIIQDQTLLTTIVDVEQVYAYFDLDEPTLIKINGQVIDGKIQAPVGATQVLMALGTDSNFGLTGTLDFINNVVNPATGTISVRGIYDNQKKSGTRLLVPGMFVRIRLPIGLPHVGTLVVDRAISSDQGLKYVYVVDSNNVIQTRRVVIGPLQDDGLRVIEPYQAGIPNKRVESGLRPDERVVVGSLPQLRAQMEITPQDVPMPIPGGTGTAMTTPPAPLPTPKK